MIRDRPLVRKQASLRTLIDGVVGTLTIPPAVKLHITGVDALPEVSGDPIAAAAGATQPAGKRPARGGTARHGGRTCRGAGPGDRAVVADSGPGVDPIVRQRPFEPLISGKPNGIGLGLALVKRFIERHEGTITYAPRPGSKGALLSSSCPSAGRNERARPPHPADCRRQSRPRRQPEGRFPGQMPAIWCSTRPAAAAALAETSLLCVALVDVRLTDGDGITLAQQLKERRPDSEVIFHRLRHLESATAAVRPAPGLFLLSRARPMSSCWRSAKRCAASPHRRKRQLARRAMVAEKLAAVGTLAAGLSHEIRNPLNAASLQLTLLERRLRRLHAETQSPLLEPLSLVQQELQRLTHIVKTSCLLPAPVSL